MKVATIQIDFGFCAAHHLPYHSGKCRNNHGHNYLLSVYVEGEVRRAKQGEMIPDDGMVLEFDTIKEVVQKKVLDVLDHSTLNDKLWGDFLPPTTENLVYWIFDQLFRSALGDYLVMVSVKETPRQEVAVLREQYIDWMSEPQS